MRVGWRKMLIKPPSGLEFEAMVVYPGLQIGWEAPQDASGAPYPVVLFGHGYSTNPDAHMSTLQHIASWGLVVVAPEVTAVYHLRYANEISVTISHMEREQLHESGQFYKLLDMQHIGGYAHTADAGCLLLCAAKGPADQDARAGRAARDDAVVGQRGERGARADQRDRGQGRLARLARQRRGPHLQVRQHAEAAACRDMRFECVLLRRRRAAPRAAAARGAPACDVVPAALPQEGCGGVALRLGLRHAQQLEGLVGR